MIDDKAIKSIADRFNADVSASGFRKVSETLINREHFQHNVNKAPLLFRKDSDPATLRQICQRQTRRAPESN